MPFGTAGEQSHGAAGLGQAQTGSGGGFGMGDFHREVKEPKLSYGRLAGVCWDNLGAMANVFTHHLMGFTLEGREPMVHPAEAES